MIFQLSLVMMVLFMTPTPWDRWSDPDRSDLMLQQTPHRQGAPWDKVRSVGSNMKQMTTGPDGNPTAAFTGMFECGYCFQLSGEFASVMLLVMVVNIMMESRATPFER